MQSNYSGRQRHVRRWCLSSSWDFCLLPNSKARYNNWSNIVFCWKEIHIMFIKRLSPLFNLNNDDVKMRKNCWMTDLSGACISKKWTVSFDWSSVLVETCSLATLAVQIFFIFLKLQLYLLTLVLFGYQDTLLWPFKTACRGVMCALHICTVRIEIVNCVYNAVDEVTCIL